MKTPDWQLPPEAGPYTLEPSWVDLWLINLDCGAQSLRLYQQMLAADEYKRMQQFSQLAKQREYAVTRGCLRSLLSRYLSIQSDMLRLEYSSQGKPRLKGCDNITFSVSHCSDRALIALCGQGECGVDIENSKRSLPLLPIAQRFFHPLETARLQQISDPQLRKSLFFRLWTIKEALGKASGGGNVYALHQNVLMTALSTDVASSFNVENTTDNASWWGLVFSAMPEYTAALVSSCRPETIRYRHWQHGDHQDLQ